MAGTFQERHIGTDAAAQRVMLDALGYDTVDALVKTAVPASIHVTARETTDIPPAATEAEALEELRALASQNRVARPLIGLGYYDTFTPSVIARNVLENPSWYTAYTPYQPEISQGRLEALINFQTMVTDLTGLTTANASMLDESTAVVEGMLVARRASKSSSNVFVVDADVFPQTRALLHARAAAVGIELVELDLAAGAILPEALFGVLVQYPGASGRVWDPSGVIDAAHVAGGLVGRRGRSARPHAPALARLARRGCRRRHDAALRRPARLRRTPRRLHGRALGSRAPAPGAPRGRVDGCRGQARLPSLAPDARAAHPPREGHVEHLHGAGAPRRDGVDVRRLPRSFRAHRDRDRGRAEGRGARAASARVRPAPRVGLVLRHDPRRDAGSRRAASWSAPGRRAISCTGSTTRRSASRSTRRRPRTTWRRSRGPSAFRPPTSTTSGTCPSRAPPRSPACRPGSAATTSS